MTALPIHYYFTFYPNIKEKNDCEMSKQGAHCPGILYLNLQHLEAEVGCACWTTLWKQLKHFLFYFVFWWFIFTKSTLFLNLFGLLLSFVKKEEIVKSPQITIRENPKKKGRKRRKMCSNLAFVCEMNQSYEILPRSGCAQIAMGLRN